MKRLAPFLRSILPDDLTQLLFLGGLVCLTVAPRLKWTPATPEALQMLSRQYGSDIGRFGAQVLSIWRPFVTLVILPILFIAFAAYWIAFWPGSQPAQRVLKWVLLPVSLTLCAICGLWLYLTSAPASVLDAHGGLRRSPKELIATLWTIGPGLHFFMFGIFLLVVFAVRLIVKKTSLPLRLGERSEYAVDGEPWRRVQVLIWAMFGPQALVFSALSFAAFLVMRGLPASWFSVGIMSVNSMIELGALIGISLIAVGGEPTKSAWRLVNLAKPNFAILGLLFPGLLGVVMIFVSYASNRAEWAARELGQYAPPAFLPDDLRFNPQLLLLLLAAFAEEFVFRGILHQRLIDRYGLYRGLVLVGVIWGAFHFPLDRYSGLSDVEILGTLLSRVAICVAMGFVLSWLTLRSGSILPATLAHGVSNILIFAGFLSDVRFGAVLRIAVWVMLAYVLFRYWPPQTDDAGGLVASPAAAPAISTSDAI